MEVFTYKSLDTEVLRLFAIACVDNALLVLYFLHKHVTLPGRYSTPQMYLCLNHMYNHYTCT